MFAGFNESPQWFPMTQWSLVGRAGSGDADARREALQRLLARYLPALRAHLVCARRIAPETADDLLQEFVLDKVLQKELIARADQRLGKFRTLLLTALTRFVSNRFRDQRAKKRSPGDGMLIALGEDVDQLAAPEAASLAFDAGWARAMITEALSRMRAECESSGRPDVWEVFRCRVVDPILEGRPAVDYGELIERFGLRSPSQATNLLVTAKRMYARALRSVVAEHAQDEQEAESEIIELREALATGRQG